MDEMPALRILCVCTTYLAILTSCQFTFPMFFVLIPKYPDIYRSHGREDGDRFVRGVPQRNIFCN